MSRSTANGNISRIWNWLMRTLKHLGSDIFSRTVLYGRQFGPLGTPSVFKTTFGWVLAGTINGVKFKQPSGNCYLTTISPDELLRQFWEIEDHNYRQPVLSSGKQVEVQHFESSHSRDELGRFIVLLPIKSDVTPLGDSRTSTVKRFESLGTLAQSQVSI